MKCAILTLATLLSPALAAVSLYGQCGGKNWTGETTCVSGAVCQYSNEYYSQCVPGTASSSSATLSTSTTTQTKTATSTTSKTTPTSTDFVTTSGTRFTIDGETKYFAGTNCYWCSFLPLESDAETVMTHLEAAGLKILRVWGFNDVNTKPSDSSTVWFQYLSSSGSEINTGSNGLERLDWIVAAAENHGIKLIVNFVNNWNDYGGMAAYISAFGGDHAGWYTNTDAQTQYRKYIDVVVSRYIDSSAILAWELANEPRCQSCDTSVIHDWATDVSAYIKSLDPDHLVTLGDEGFGLDGDGSYPYTYYEGSDWEKLLTIDTLDFATFHLYPTSWGVSTDWGNDWVEAHAALCAEYGKPCFFEEYGMTYDQCSIESEWQETSLAADGMAADAFWQFGDTISSGQSHNDGNTIYYGSDTWTCLVTNHVADIS